MLCLCGVFPVFKCVRLLLDLTLRKVNNLVNNRLYQILQCLFFSALSDHASDLSSETVTNDGDSNVTSDHSSVELVRNNDGNSNMASDHSSVKLAGLPEFRHDTFEESQFSNIC